MVPSSGQAETHVPLRPWKEQFLAGRNVSSSPHAVKIRCFLLLSVAPTPSGPPMPACHVTPCSSSFQPPGEGGGEERRDFVWRCLLQLPISPNKQSQLCFPTAGTGISLFRGVPMSKSQARLCQFSAWPLKCD